MQEYDWRLEHVTGLLKAEGVPYLETKSLVRDQMRRLNRSAESFFIRGDGHPNDDLNALVADAIAEQLGPMCMAPTAYTVPVLERHFRPLRGSAAR